VIWSPEAEAELARLYLKSRPRTSAEFWKASALIDRHLRHNPDQSGAPIEDYPGLLAMSARISTRERLAVVYRIVPDDMQVFVVDARVLPEDA
jgi:hypothetical protein